MATPFDGGGGRPCFWGQSRRSGWEYTVGVRDGTAVDWHCLELELRRREAFYYELQFLSGYSVMKCTPAPGPVCHPAARRGAWELPWTCGGRQGRE